MLDPEIANRRFARGSRRVRPGSGDVFPGETPDGSPSGRRVFSGETTESNQEITPPQRGSNVRRSVSRAAPRQREMTADELNDIALGVYTRGSGATSEMGPQGDIARRIASASGMKKGGQVKRMAKGGVVRGDGCAIRGKTKGKVV